MTATQVKLRRTTFLYIEGELYAYPQTLKEIQTLRQDIMFCNESDDENTGGGRSNVPGRPTERIATRLATDKKIKRLEEIANSIECVYVSLDETKQRLIKLKYWTRPQTKTWEGIAQELNVSRRTAIYFRDAIVNDIAEKLGER